MKKTLNEVTTIGGAAQLTPMITTQRLAPKPTSSLRLLNVSDGRDAFLHYFENTWGLTESLFSALVSEEAYYLRPYHKTRHPLIFYYAHPVTFYVNKLLVAGLIDEPVNAHFEVLFETGVDEMSWDDLHEGDQTIWPTLTEVVAYRKKVYQLVRTLIQTHPMFEETITQASPAWALAMCFEHERIHLETSSVLMRELPPEHLKTPENWPKVLLSETAGPNSEPKAGSDYPATNPMIAVDATQVRLGKPADWPSFGWDNEYGTDTRDCAAFKASQRLISNGEYYEFVASGGYLEDRFWSQEGLAWRRFRNTRWPSFWVQDGPVGSHRFKLRTTFSVEPMQWSWPVVANYYEAKAYCAWRSERDDVAVPYRLLKEAEHIALREPVMQDSRLWDANDVQRTNIDRVMADEAELASRHEVNNNLHFGSEGPVDKFAANNRGFNDVFGNVWQWCEDAFHPLPEFKIHPYYVDFSTPCFDGQHQMILGGSFISTGDEASMWSRFHFRPHFFQHAGFRMVQSEEDLAQEKDRYETNALLNQYMLFHYGSKEENRDVEISARAGHPDVQEFIPATVELVTKYAEHNGKVLDLGCAVGRASFELSKTFDEVIGLDYSQSFVDAALRMKQYGKAEYRRHETGRYYSQLLAELSSDCKPARVQFLQGDAGALNEAKNMQGFDAVLLSNLLCRLPDPRACLRQFVEDDNLLNKGAVLVIVSPNSWMDTYTDAEQFLDAPNSGGALERLATILTGFELLHEDDLPFMIREHRRKYEYVVSQVSIWKKC